MRCKFCGDDHYPQGTDNLGANLEGVVTLTFDSGRTYSVPVNLDHFIINHELQPPASLIGDLMNSRYVETGVIHAQGRPVVVKVDEDYQMGGVPAAAPYRLRDAIKAAVKARDRVD
jgi:hypothetical protein